MDQINTSIHYLYHSSFTVETSNHFLIFDYYYDQVDEGKIKSLENGLIIADFIKDKKNVLVFVSHSHGDHFNPVIFQWQESNPGITYILSSDVTAPSNVKNIFTMDAQETLELEDGTLIKAYGTTDKGVSFMVEVDRLNIYHAGDLNWWHWKSFTKEQQLKEEEDFKKEVAKITEAVDIAFVPVDPRLDEYYYLAGEYYANTLKPKLIIPMHFADKSQICRDFSTKMKDHPVTTAILSHRGQVVEFSKFI